MRETEQHRRASAGGRSARGRGLSTALALVFFVTAAAAAIADQASEVAALESQCAAAREARIKPLREAEIAKCKASRQDDPGYCERYWSDYGNARRLPNGTMSARMFDDLPVCVTAAQARQALNQSSR